MKSISTALEEFSEAENEKYDLPQRQIEGQASWYVIQVRTGTEENIRIQCEKFIKDKRIMKTCFIPYYEEKKRFQGRWNLQKKILFPGYIFVITQDALRLHEILKQVMGLTRILKIGETMIALTQKEVAFMERFGGLEQIVGMSEGIIEGSQIIISSGPLQGLEGYIKKIDRHKRKAWVELPMFGRLQKVEVGLEIVRKTV
ncbi:transcriptional antiterminator NusG [Catenibacillus scindens]|uniref:Transcription termination/antitermination protein NusG n=1 Tax=Catenibacillus scindens TaxID=673271 RepID=A0A7W8HBH4_9FIRM|nr:antiterminator LoaP [Catenibacillus scindens]MBB5265394.1 transcriptional antiterminator NusG [Catenibacillus scindens]